MQSVTIWPHDDRETQHRTGVSLEMNLCRIDSVADFPPRYCQSS
jgi:hypothetical protein